MIQTRLDSFISIDVCKEIELSTLKKMTDEEATCLVEDKKIILAIRPSIVSGYWNVTKDERKKKRPWKVRKHQLYRLTKDINSFQSRIAAAIFISRRLGNLAASCSS